MNHLPRCRVCNGIYVPDAIHVIPDRFGTEPCIPMDNLEYLELVLKKKEQEK